MNQTLRRILEMVGMVESQQVLLRRKLGMLSQKKPQGKASLILRSVGAKQNSAVAIIRDLTGLELSEVLLLLNQLPAPLLIHVSAETAVAAQRKLDRLGVKTEIIGLPTSSENVTVPSEVKSAQKPARQQKKPFSIRKGNYAVTLTSIGLLGERVLDGVQRITGRTIPGLAKLEEALPLIVLEGVDQETAVKAQTYLQMVGAVVDIDELQERADQEGPHSAAEILGYALWLSEVGSDRVGVVRALAEILQTDMMQATALVDGGPGYILKNVGADQVLQALEKLEAFGATVEILEPEEQPAK